MSMHRIAIILALFGLHTVSSLQEVNSIDADQVQDSKALRGRLLSHDTPEWWPKIKSYYDGKDLQLCRSKDAPKSGSNCGYKKKTCFFETQKCSKVGVYPKKRCSCNGSKKKKGKWSCEQAKCPARPIKTASPTPAPTPSPKGTFVSSAGRAFKVKMSLLSSKVLDGYDNVKDLKSDLYQAIRFYVNALIEEQSMYDGNYLPVGVGGGPPSNEDSTGNSPPSAEGATDFETNNQEKGIDESDMVKSDGKFVYAAYGDMVVVWNSLTGKLVENYTLPPIYDKSPTPAPRKSSSDMKLDIMPPIDYNPRPYILSMSLAANRLVLYVQGYGEKLRAEENYSSPFWNDFDTRIVIMDTSTLPSKITFVSQEDIQGSFVSGSSIGSDVHVVTTSYMDFYRLAGPLYRWNRSFKGMNKAQYKAAAAEIAVPLITDYVEALFDSIVTKGIAPSMPKISLWQSNLGENENIVESIYSGGAIQAYMQLTSFSVKGLNGKATFSKAGVFTPSGWGYTYAIEGNLVFAAQGWNWSPWLRGSSQTTYLLGFKLDGASATPAYLGSVDGYILNQYSLSIFEGHLRIATTVDTFWPIWEPSGSETTTPQPESRTNNTVHVLRLPKGDDASLKPVTSIRNLGKPNERFTSFRCFKIICYAVTFLQTDPFYVLDMNPDGAKVLGELEISGFSSYLHSINADDTLLVTAGQEADADGRILGLQISLFDSTVSAKPKQLHRLVVEQDTEVWSSSSVQWDFKSFRWLSLGDSVGILIMPLQIYSFNGTMNFDGFKAYDVSRKGIAERLTITHADSSQYYGCYYPAYLPERSFVFNGNVTTMKGHSVISTDLNTGDRRWTLDMPKPEDKKDCQIWWF